MSRPGVASIREKREASRLNDAPVTLNAPARPFAKRQVRPHGQTSETLHAPTVLGPANFHPIHARSGSNTQNHTWTMRRKKIPAAGFQARVLLRPEAPSDANAHSVGVAGAAHQSHTQPIVLPERRLCAACGRSADAPGSPARCVFTQCPKRRPGQGCPDLPFPAELEPRSHRSICRVAKHNRPAEVPTANRRHALYDRSRTQPRRPPNARFTRA